MEVSSGSDVQRPWFVRALFLVPVLLVITQFLLIRAGHGEPYPALMMPGFKSTLTAPNGNIQVESVTIVIRFADGSTATETLRTLFDVLPTSHHWTVATGMFRPPSGPSSETPAARSALKSWLIRHLTPIRDRLAERRRPGRPIEPDTITWLRGRLHEMHPGRTATQVEFEWRLDERQFADNGPALVRQRVLDRHAITLPGPADARP